METTKTILTSAVGLTASAVTQQTAPDNDQIVSVAVQLLIGIVTLWKLIKKPKNN